MRKKLVGGVATVALVATFSGKASAAEHTVKPGDTLWNIANHYKTTVTKIKELNKLSSDIIYPRQVLQINGSSTANSTSTTPAVKASTKNSTTNSTPSTGSTYTVKSGDYLMRIASSHGITLAQLKQWNGLTSDLIRPGQVLRVSGGSASAPAPTTAAASTSNSSGNNSGNTANATTYKVVSGDTLGRIASKYRTTVAQLKQLNGLRSDLIYVGQVLRLNGSAPAGTTVKQTAASVSQPVQSKVGNVVTAAKQHLGVKYVWGGTTPAGFDCSGFIYYAFKQAGQNISRTSADGYFNRSYYVKTPQPGDLVFFENTYKRGISHLGIFLGGNQFIHAGNNGVEIASLSNSYWKSKFNGYKRFY
ncbi:peptidoglycan endopeptidase [Siminovitchia acidinfaciens]|uniref:Peptidoglycan endopeptidase n=1 Tax=Siminovitchia acidinfaciens TaxID=2321395 RepID=A0A429Y6M1_9BACI|nr:peptidoglycan endopeptidase [Siminovitchia acidinfaciens]RST77099.1 peptidoglycan endopeptidase [Siminovitchia acidinfaciens]